MPGQYGLYCRPFLWHHVGRRTVLIWTCSLFDACKIYIKKTYSQRYRGKSWFGITCPLFFMTSRPLQLQKTLHAWPIAHSLDLCTANYDFFGRPFGPNQSFSIQIKRDRLLRFHLKMHFAWIKRLTFLFTDINLPLEITYYLYRKSPCTVLAKEYIETMTFLATLLIDFLEFVSVAIWSFRIDFGFQIALAWGLQSFTQKEISR